MLIPNSVIGSLGRKILGQEHEKILNSLSPNCKNNPNGVKHDSPGCPTLGQRYKQNVTVMKGRNTERIREDVLRTFSADFSYYKYPGLPPWAFLLRPVGALPH